MRLTAHDPGLAAVRRAGRAAVIMPGSFALCLKVLHNPTMAAFAAFSAIANLLLVEFRGPLEDRVRDQAALIVVGAGLVCVGTLCSRSDVAAVAGMAVIGVVVIFAGVVSSVLASASTSLLLAFILPVSLAGPAASIPDRIAGWGLSGGLTVLAVALMWPSPAADPLRGAAVGACRALADRLRGRDGSEPAATSALAAVNSVFLATPFRPSGLTTAARAGVRLVDELRWAGDVALGPAGERLDAGGPAVDAVLTAGAETLERCAELLADPRRPPEPLTRAREALAAVASGLRDELCLPRSPAKEAAEPLTDDAEVAAFVDALDPAFRAQELSFVVAQIATNVELVGAASRRGWVARTLGRTPPGIGGALSSAAERGRSHLTPQSVWLRNSLRGGAALSMAVLVARLVGVEHAFWVSFGTLSILRSNALATGQTYLRALVGTSVGFVVGAVLVLAIGTNTTLLWILLPFAVLIGGIAPVVISFAGGQAAFTVVLFILFNILAPEGWRIGLVRIEDVALGGATSLVVGLVFWPRGAGAALGRALGDAYAEAAEYLAGAVAYAVTCCAPGIPDLGPAARGVLPESIRAAASSRRLDDTFRTYLAEGGHKRLPLAQVTTVVNGASALRLAADAIIDLWREETASTQSRIGAARELLARARTTEEWYRRLQDALLTAAPAPAPEPADPRADARLLATIDHDLRSADGQATATAVRVVWTGDHLEAVRRLEALLAEPLQAIND